MLANATARHALRDADISAAGVPRTSALLAIADTERILACRAVGLPIDGKAFGWMSVRQTLRCFDAARAAGDVAVETRIARLGNSSLEFAQRIRGDAGATVAEVTSVMVFVDRSTDRPVRIPDTFREALSALAAG